MLFKSTYLLFLKFLLLIFWLLEHSERNLETQSIRHLPALGLKQSYLAEWSGSILWLPLEMINASRSLPTHSGGGV